MNKPFKNTPQKISDYVLGKKQKNGKIIFRPFKNVPQNLMRKIIQSSMPFDDTPSKIMQATKK